jgi:ribonuclease-3 family protein
MSDVFRPALSDAEINRISSLGLAHIGDAVFELLVRTHLCLAGGETASGLHREAVKMVNAGAQAAYSGRLAGRLSEEEAAVFRREGRKGQYRPEKTAVRRTTTRRPGLSASSATCTEKQDGAHRRAFWNIVGEEAGRIRFCHMPLDALCLAAAAAELRAAAVARKSGKIQHPEKDVFLFSLRGAGAAGGLRLLIRRARARRGRT